LNFTDLALLKGQFMQNFNTNNPSGIPNILRALRG
jgi:hypothetical protein